MRGEIVRATKTHALMMAPHVRAAEVREIMDAEGMTPVELLVRDMDRSVSAWSWIIDGDVACMFGVVADVLLSDVAYPWFLSTPLVDENAVAFARACRRHLPELLGVHAKLAGMVDARYELSVRWLQWLGAKVGSPEPWGIAGAQFRPFTLEA
ncbi:hypothetical protein P3T24_004397 [Paraburkholderia sp. GAS33]|uniref:hypothetical protein n=1 Tax=Paraburkholderia sp. GAS33 TaxID=3035130 RepID=UPI003D193157